MSKTGHTQRSTPAAAQSGAVPAPVSRTLRANTASPALKHADTATARQSEQILHDAIHHLGTAHKDQCARDGLWPWQKTALALGAAIFTAAAIVDPATATALAATLLSLFFLAIVCLRILACIICARSPAGQADDGAPAGPLPHDLPVYTVLVPLYREAVLLPQLIEALTRLDYPPHLLDIKIILESDDTETLNAAAALSLPAQFELITVPAAQPRTKPKALNYALHFARGDFVTIYDAEDQPSPDQLRKCLALFQSGPPTLACIQARLNFYNGTENWLTKQFTIEYSSLFDALLPALEKLRLPIPLGGTSNHFRMAALRRAGLWDAFNLTEDADLGMRLYRHGYQCAVLNSTTYEEANCRLTSWIKQRTRWLKGWLQTYFVHMRKPRTLWRDLGARGFIGFQVLIGGLIVSALAHPIFYVFLCHGLVTGTALARPETLFGEPLWLLALFNLAIGYCSAMALGVFGLRSRGLQRLTPHILFMPFYWMLISIAAYRAIYQLTTAPFLWEKTAHGLTRRKAAARYG